MFLNVKRLSLLQMIGLLLNVLFLKINCRWKTVMLKFPRIGKENLFLSDIPMRLKKFGIKSGINSVANVVCALNVNRFWFACVQNKSYSPRVKSSSYSTW